MVCIGKSGGIRFDSLGAKSYRLVLGPLAIWFGLADFDRLIGLLTRKDTP